MSKIPPNIDFMHDSTDERSRLLLECLSEIRFTIPEYHIVNYLGYVGMSRPRERLLHCIMHSYISQRKPRPRLYRKPTEDEVVESMDNLLSNGYLVEINEFHLDTIHRLLDMCQITYRGFLPEINQISLTPKGFSVYRYWRETVFGDGYIEDLDGAAIFGNGESRFGEKIIVGYCAVSSSLLTDIMNRPSVCEEYEFDLNQIQYCGQWCRKWYKILPTGYLCETKEKGTERFV